MTPNVDERLASVIRALTEVVLPHLPPEASLAQEQVHLRDRPSANPARPARCHACFRARRTGRCDFASGDCAGQRCHGGAAQTRQGAGALFIRRVGQRWHRCSRATQGFRATGNRSLGPRGCRATATQRARPRSPGPFLNTKRSAHKKTANGSRPLGSIRCDPARGLRLPLHGQIPTGSGRRRWRCRFVVEAANINAIVYVVTRPKLGVCMADITIDRPHFASCGKTSFMSTISSICRARKLTQVRLAQWPFVRSDRTAQALQDAATKALTIPASISTTARCMSLMTSTTRQWTRLRRHAKARPGIRAGRATMSRPTASPAA